MDSELNKHGGRRPGAGRKPTGAGKLISLRVPRDMEERLSGLPNRSRFIQQCVRAGLEAAGPDFSRLGATVQATEALELTLPFFDIEVAAGFPIPLDNDERAQDIEILQMLCPHPESCYLIRIKGDSMVDADIQDGDIIIVDKSQRTPRPNQPAVCELNGEYTVKYVRRVNGQPCLVPANDAYPLMPITEGDSFAVWGVVTYIIHRA